MQSTSTSIPGFRVPDPPDVDLPFPLNRSRKVRKGVGDAIQGSYIAGGAQGFSIGQTVGCVEGHVAGAIEGSALTAVVFGFVFFCACILMRLARK